MFLLSRIPFLSGPTEFVQGIFVHIGTSISGAIGRLTKSENQVILERDYYQKLAGDLAVDQSKVEQLEKDVDEMQALLSYTKTSPYSSIAARVIARSEEGVHTIVVNKGTNDGVQPKFAVIVENGHMIGYVQSVTKTSAKVLLLENEESRVPGMIIGTDETVGLVEGQGGYLLHMAFIPQRVELEEGAVVVTSGLDGIFPKGIVIGAISSVEKNVTSSFQDAFIEPFYDPDEYTNVLILNPFAENL